MNSQARYGDLAALFAPASIAVVGASGDPTKFGGRVLAYLKDGFAGRVHAVNARQAEVQGLPCHARVADIAEPVDLAVLAVPADACAAALADCVTRGVRAAIVFSSGFAEAGDDGRARQAALVATARAGGLRLLGPNCIGAASEARRMAATFATMWAERRPAAGGVSVVSQSGALASYLYVLLRERGVGVAHWASTGNEADVDVAECIRYFAGDAETRVIVAAMEGLRDGARLRAALDAARAAKKPVLLLKLGRSAVGTEAALSHTGALAGDDRVFDAAIAQHGALRCRDFGHAVDVATACALARYPAGRRLGIVSASGGGGIMAADMAETLGLDVPALDAATRARLDAMLPGGASRNPVDVTAMVLSDVDLMVRPIAEVARAGVDGVVVFLTSAFRSDAAVDALRARFRACGLDRIDAPILLSGWCPDAAKRRWQDDRVALYDEPTRAVEVFAALAVFADRWRRDDAARQAAAPEAAGTAPIAFAATDEAALLDALAAHGLPVAASRLATTADAAVDTARTLGHPVVLKLSVAGLAHKTEVDGVRLGLGDAEAVRAAFAALNDAARRAGLAARWQGVVVQKQQVGATEMLLGLSRDPAFGWVVAVGLGGRLVELLDDVAIRVTPVDADEARRMIASLRGAPLLAGYRGRPPADVDALVAAIVALSRLAPRLPADVASLEVNPFLLGGPGFGGVAVDAKLTLVR